MKTISIHKEILFFLSTLFFINFSPAFAQELEKLFEMSIEELMNVEVVTASKKPQRLSEVPATVRVITAEQIKERGYFTLEEALSDLPGIQFRNIVGFNSYVFIRGAYTQNQSILVLVDGIQINELNSGGFYGGGQYNLSNVKKIEVVYGPASALYGTNAISGIINIITNDPKDIHGARASVLLGNFETRNFDFMYGHYNQENDFGFSISGMFKQSDKADLRGAKGDNNWTNNMENFEDDLAFDGKVIYKNISLGLIFQDKQASRTTNYKTIDADYLDSGTIWHIRFVNGHVKYVYDKSSNWSNQCRLYYRNATVMDNTIAYIKSDTGATGGQTGYYRPNDLIGFENQFTSKPINKLSIIAGFVLEKERLAQSFSMTHSGSPEIKPPKPPKPVMDSNGLASIYLQAQYKFVKSTELTLGFRHDNSSYYGKINTPRIGFVFNRNKLTTKLLYTEAFRAPKPWDYTYEEGNPDLKPEIMRSVELAAAYVFTENFIANLSFYKNYMKGKFTREELRQTNGPDMTTDGFEVALEYAQGKIKSHINYTYNSSVYDNGEIVPEIGKHNVNIGILYTFTKKIKLDIRGNYIGERKNVKIITSKRSDYIDDAFVFYSTLSFLNFKGFNFQLILKNILDTEYYHSSNNPPDRYRQPQRIMMLKVGYKY
jgi:outer membrane receptor for ferrienterochelin and colicins